MDPNAALKMMRLRAEELLSGTHTSNDEEIDAGLELAEYACALDEWLTNGGFMPEDWKHANPAHWQQVLTSTNARAFQEGYAKGKRAVSDLM